MKKTSFLLIFIASLVGGSSLSASTGTPGQLYSMSVTSVLGASATLAASPVAICKGESSTLTATGSGGAPYHFDWSSSSGPFPPGSTTAGNTASSTVSPTVTTTYSVTVTARFGTSNQDMPVIKTLALTVNSLPVVDAGPGGTFCPGDMVSLGGTPTASGGTPAFSYNWTPYASINSPQVANPVATPTSTTTYAVLVTDNAGCTGSASCVWTKCTATGVQESMQSAFSVFPSPCRDAATLRMESPEPGTAVEVRDLLGRLVFRHIMTYEREVKIPMSKEVPGIYILTVQGSQGRRVSRLLKE